MLNPLTNGKIQGLFKAYGCFSSTFQGTIFSRTFQDSPVYSSTFQACANPVQYMSIIREAASRSSSLFWRTFDKQFRLRQAANVQSWGAINNDLWLRIMTMPTAPFKAETPTVRKNTCFDFNNDSCHWNSCKFLHVCSNWQ